MAINSWRFWRITVYANKIERGCNGENTPWRGYCWGSDWPRANWQAGSTCYCLDLSWLCYFVSIYWRRDRKDPK